MFIAQTVGGRRIWLQLSENVISLSSQDHWKQAWAFLLALPDSYSSI